MMAPEIGGLQIGALPPLTIYIHLPWCVRKCPYCDFNSHALSGPIPTRQLIKAILVDLDYDLPWVQGRPVESIFLGGGTPSLVSPAGIAEILDGVQHRLKFAPHCEITIEANPGTVNRRQLRGYLEAGVNRLSIGVQSFNNSMLQALGRIHDRKAAIRAIEDAAVAGFDRINLDLMHSLPGQTLAAAMDDLQLAISFGTGHLSWYQLTIEPNTRFGRSPPALPPEDLQWQIHTRGEAMLGSHYRHYEISAFARPAHESVHNLNYWRFGDYLGLGPGAHGKITLADKRQIIRSRKYRMPTQYMQARARKLAQLTVVDRREIPLEFMLNALRLTAGVSRSLYRLRSGLPLSSIEGFLAEGRARGLLRKGPRIQPTRFGLRYLNDLLALV